MSPKHPIMSPPDSKAQKTILIVGGGFAGVPAFNELSKHIDPNTDKLVLVNPRSHFIHLPAACRLVVSQTEPNYEDKVLLPFTARFNEANRKTICAKVVSIHDDKDEANRYVTLDNGDKVAYTYLLLAPGSIWEEPLDFPNTKEESVKKLKEWHDRFEKAKDIVLVGGGGVSFGKFRANSVTHMLTSSAYQSMLEKLKTNGL